MPETIFMPGVIIDDALYYLIPAQNLIAGHDYSFDGQHRTNGVQPLWALLTLVIAKFQPDPLTAARLLSLSSATAWLLGGLILFIAIRNIHWGTATLATTGYLASGFWRRTALTGMENGLTALATACVIYVGIYYLYLQPRQGKSRLTLKFYGYLGITCVFMWLARIEQILLVAILSLAFLWVPLKPSKKRRGLALLLLPTISLFSTYMLLNRFYFGVYLPISGSVKLNYELEWLTTQGYPAGSFWANLKWHIYFIFEMALDSLLRILDIFPISIPETALIGVVLTIFIGAILLTGPAIVKIGEQTLIEKYRVLFWSGLGLFGLSHFFLIIVFFPHFTNYGTWYFAAEVLLIWLAFAASFSRLLAFFFERLKIPQTLGFVTVFGLASLTFLSSLSYQKKILSIEDPRPIVFINAGKWLNTHLKPGQKIGTLSSGYVSYYSPSHQVINLDGLMNNSRFFSDYLRTNKVLDYIREEEIHYLADYRSLNSWKDGFGWRGLIPLERLELVKWWQVDQENGYGIWFLNPQAPSREILDSCTGFCDRFSQIQFAAAFLESIRVIPHRELEDFLEQHPDYLVATSYSYLGSSDLNHVVMPNSEYMMLDINPTELDIHNKFEATFGGSFKLLGFDVSSWTVERGGEFRMTRYWSGVEPQLKGTGWEIKTFIDFDNLGQTLHTGAGCYHTCPFDIWSPGEIYGETYQLTIPSDIPPGVYPIQLGLRHPEKGFLSVDQPISSLSRELIQVGQLIVKE